MAVVQNLPDINQSKPTQNSWISKTVPSLDQAGLDAAAHYLELIPASCLYEEWLNIGHALNYLGKTKYQTDAYSLFLNWSLTFPKEDTEKACSDLWKNADPTKEDGVKLNRIKEIAEKYRKQTGGQKYPISLDGTSGPVAAPVSKGSAPDLEALIAARKKAMAFYMQCHLATDTHEYLVRKHAWAKTDSPFPLKVVPDGLKSPFSVDVTGWLVAPRYSFKGELLTLQFISPELKTSLDDKPKRNFPGLTSDGVFFLPGGVETAARQHIYIAEGLGHIFTLSDADQSSGAVCTFGVDGLKNAALLAHEYYPDAEITVVSDKGQEAKALEAAEAVGGAWVPMPLLFEDGKDINDYEVSFKADGRKHVCNLLKTYKQRPAPVQESSPVPGAAPVSVESASSDSGNVVPDVMPFLDGNQLVADFVVRPELIEDLFQKIGVGIMSGAKQTGKTFFALDLAFTVHNEPKWRGRDVEGGDVYFIAAEAGSNIDMRLLGVKKKHPEWKVPSVSIVAPDLANPAWFDSIEKGIEDKAAESPRKPVLIIIDTFSASFNGNDKEQEDVVPVLKRMRVLAERFGCFVLFTHHPTKANPNDPRGTGAFTNDVDTVILLSRPDDKKSKMRNVLVDKVKEGQDGETFQFALSVVTIGKKKNDKPLTTLTVEYVEIPNQDMPYAPPSVEALRGLFAELSQEHKPVTLGMVLDRWLEGYIKENPDKVEKYPDPAKLQKHYRTERSNRKIALKEYLKLQKDADFEDPYVLNLF